jgi:hypothetical protein
MLSAQSGTVIGSPQEQPPLDVSKEILAQQGSSVSVGLRVTRHVELSATTGVTAGVKTPVSPEVSDQAPGAQSLLPLGIPGEMPTPPGGGTAMLTPTQEEQPSQPQSFVNAGGKEPEPNFEWGTEGAGWGQGFWHPGASAPLTIVPTIYPVPTGDTVTVEDPVSINLGSVEFREFKETIERLCTAIEQSNQTSREVADKLVAELQAGLRIIEGPKPSRKLVGLLLVGPLLTAAGMFAPGFVGELAKHAADLLLKLIGAG